MSQLERRCQSERELATARAELAAWLERNRGTVADCRRPQLTVPQLTDSLQMLAVSVSPALTARSARTETQGLGGTRTGRQAGPARGDCHRGSGLSGLISQLCVTHLTIRYASKCVSVSFPV